MSRSSWNSLFESMFSQVTKSNTLAPRSRQHSHRQRVFETLEDRRLLTVLPPVDPIEPSRGESNLLRVVQMHADKLNLNAQDHSPVPFTVFASAGNSAVTVKNWKAGAPLQLDADDSKATGKGNSGHDIRLEINTDLYTNEMGQPDWRLRLNVERLGTSKFAENLSVVISFPFDAFDSETTLPGAPNIMMGFQTRLPGTPGESSYIVGLDGGIAPETVQMVVTPHVLAGTTHAFEWDILTTGATNPITFLSGEFDGSSSTGILNALGWQAYVQNVPAHIAAQINVAENAIGSPAVDSKMDFLWNASSASLTTFDYFEAESAAATSGPTAADYATQIVADPMPTSEHFVLQHDEAAGTLTLNHDSNAPIREMTFFKRRSDGLVLSGVAADETPGADAVPTHVALTVGLQGFASLDVNANTLDLLVQDTQVGGFNNTSQFFEQFGLEYVAFQAKNAPDLTANFDAVTKSFAAAATNAGEAIPFVEMTLDDNGRLSATNAPLNLTLPDRYSYVPLWNLWSLTDDGTHGTAVARGLDANWVSYDHDAPTVKETVELQTTAAHPMQTYLLAGLLSAIQPPFGATPDPYIEVTGHIEDVPTGYTKVGLDFPLTVTVMSESEIGEICMFGHIGTLNFALVLEDNPTNGSFDFRPEGSLDVKALDDINQTPLDETDDVPDFFTGNAAIVSDVNGFDPNVIPLPDDLFALGFHSKHETFFPNDTRLKEARVRLDNVPSFKATWHDEDDHTYIDMDTKFGGEFAYVGGVQIQISTVTTITGELTCEDAKAALPPATEGSEHYALLKDVAGEQTLSFGVFGVDNLHFRSDDAGADPSAFELNFELDPSRPSTAAHIHADSNPTSSGALGTFFGGDDVLGDLDIAYVPNSLNLQTDLDPSLCTTGLFPLPGSDVNLNFNVTGTDILIHAHDLAPRYCVGFDVTGPTSTFSIESTNLAATNVIKTGLTEILFQNTSAGLDGGVLFGAANPVEELRLRLDDVPSVDISWTTTGANSIWTVDTTSSDNLATPGIREDILGSLRFNASAMAVLPPSVPSYPLPTGTEDHFFRLIDTASDHRLQGGVFGLDKFEIQSLGATNQLKVTYMGNVSRDLTVQVDSSNGQFFPGYDVDAGLLVSTLPQNFAMTATTDGQNVSYDASSDISQVRIGGPAVIGMPGASKGKFDRLGDPSDIRFNLDINDLPAKLTYAMDISGATQGVSITAQTPGGLPSNIGSFIGRVEDNGGFASSSSLLGAAIKDVRLRLDVIPTMTVGWATGGTGANFDFSTAAASGAYQYLQGAQVILSTDQTTLPFSAPTLSSDQKVAYRDDGGAGVKRLSAQVFGLDEFHFETTNSPRDLTLGYAADAARRLIVDVDATFGNKFFSSFDVDAVLTVTSVPQSWNLATDLATNLHYMGSSPISSITVLGNIDDTMDGMNNGTDIDFEALSLPSTVDFVLTPGSGATLTMNAGIDLISVNLQSPNKVFGSDYRYIDAALNDIPSMWTANWGGGAFGIEANAPMGVVTAVLSRSNSDGMGDQNAKRQPFTVDGPGGCRINRSEFAEEIDNRYYNASGAGGAVSPLTLLDEMYCHSEQLDPGEDHVIVRKDGGDIDFVSVQFEGFKKAAYTPDANGFNAVFEAPSPGTHPLFAGMQDGEYQTVQIQDVPDSITVDFDKTEHLNYDASSSPLKIDYYSGPLPIANDGDDATRGVILDAPSFVHLTWGFGFPSGGVNFDASNKFTLLFLTQDGSNRITAGIEMEDLQVGYGLELFSFDERGHLDIEVPVPCIGLPPVCFETLVSVPVAWELVEFAVGIDNDASDSAIDANFGKTALDGFFNLYQRKSGIEDLSGGSPAHGDQEYVPLITTMLDDFRELDVNVALVLDPLAAADGLILAYLFPVSLILDITLHGDPVFDVWVNDEVNETFTIPLVDYDIGFINHADYKENSPIHIIPIESFFGGIGIDHDAVITFSGFHGFGDHTDPFEALTAPSAIDTAQNEPLSADLLGAVIAEATAYWTLQGVDQDQLDAASNVEVLIVDLPGDMLASANGGRIRIDADAAGHGWIIGAQDQMADGGIDLLSTVTHEIGHLLGFDHDDDLAVMAPVLGVGQRWIESAAPSGKLAAIRQLVRDAKPLDARVTDTLAESIRSGIAWRTEFASPVLLESRLRTLAGPRDLMFADYRRKEAAFVEGPFGRPETSSEWLPTGTKYASLHSDAAREWTPEDSHEEVDATAVDSVVAEELQWLLAS